jgi:hypothetical protein
VRAKARYRLIVRRGSALPVRMDPDRVDTVEVVDVDEGEVVLLWDLLARDVKRVVGLVRADLQSLDDREFLERWASFEGDADLRRPPAPPRPRGRRARR